MRVVGTERFASTLFATSKDELTAEGWTKHEAHGSLSAPLTDEEQNLEGIRDAEAQESRGTGARKGGHIVEGGIKIALPPDATEALKRLNNRELDLVQLVSLYIMRAFPQADTLGVANRCGHGKDPFIIHSAGI